MSTPPTVVLCPCAVWKEDICFCPPNQNSADVPFIPQSGQHVVDFQAFGAPGAIEQTNADSFAAIAKHAVDRGSLEVVETTQILLRDFLLQNCPENPQLIIKTITTLALAQIKLEKVQDARNSLIHCENIADRYKLLDTVGSMLPAILRRMAWFYLRHGLLEDAKRKQSKFYDLVFQSDDLPPELIGLSARLCKAELAERNGELRVAQGEYRCLMGDPSVSRHGASYPPRLIILRRLEDVNKRLGDPESLSMVIPRTVIAIARNNRGIDLQQIVSTWEARLMGF